MEVGLSAELKRLQRYQQHEQQQLPYQSCGSDLHSTLTELRQQLTQMAARADSEAVKRGESERHCQAVGQQVQKLEVQAEAARRQLSLSELRAEEELRQLEAHAEKA